MNGLPLVLAILSILALSALAFSLFSLYQGRVLWKTANRRDREPEKQEQAGMEELRNTLEGLAVQVHDLQNSQPAVPGPLSHRAGLNLSKRSQALRMHRRGEPADQIAAALDIPQQEVELLIKVHRIVISNI